MYHNMDDYRIIEKTEKLFYSAFVMNIKATGYVSYILHTYYNIYGQISRYFQHYVGKNVQTIFVDTK